MKMGAISAHFYFKLKLSKVDVQYNLHIVKNKGGRAAFIRNSH